MKNITVLLVVTLGMLSSTVYAAGAQVAQAELIDAQGGHVGMANFKEKEGGGVTIEINAHGLSAGDHGMHIHMVGNCALSPAPAFSSAGSHFNPANSQHGSNNPSGPHAGDLPNLTVKENGKVATTLNSTAFTLEAGMSNSILDADGSALVIHEKADDYVTNPTGNSGSRIACGEIVKKGN